MVQRVTTKVLVLNDMGGSVMSVSDKPSTLRAQMKHHEPIVCYAIEGNVVDRASNKNGKGWCENVSPTLNTQDRHAVCVPVACFRKTAHPRNPTEGQGYEETDIADTLNVFDSGESRTPMLIVHERQTIALEGNGSRPSHMGKGFSTDGKMYTLNTIEQHSVCYEDER